ncbi:RNase adapter RapZ [uncultured Jannaschia sp.]|uniref:RNase adapter RapZ n=1 Tax=uncultured Jannaschia sp. TaxID=293347 RepID=UPI00260F8D7F|nr:RNase adapter RapZ [uncultured Jannaschia sp.]
MTRADRPIDIVLVTGPSGAGRTTALNVLEDAGFEVVDNLPLDMMRMLAGPDRAAPLALGLGVRNAGFSLGAVEALATDLRADPRFHVQLVYLQSDRETLVARYSETRRRHPLSPREDAELGVARELELLAALAESADLVIDTAGMNVHDLRAEMTRRFDGDTGTLSVSIQSFSYKRGLPRGLDLAFDVRFLANPHWVPGLRDGTGRDADVRAHVTADPHFDGFDRRVRDLVEFLLPRYRDEGRAHLSIGFGCTGGQHRSVAVTEMLADALAADGWQVSKRHRELDRRAAAAIGTGSRNAALGGTAA